MTTSSRLFIMFLTFAAVVQTYSYYLPKRDARNNGFTDPKKRPFCNAFTGCGRKRTDLPALVGNSKNDVLEESIGSLLELSAEPAVEDISRQIMSEAKLWEAIQEANEELSRARQESAEHSGEVGLSRSSASPSCVLPPCYI